MSQLHQLSWNLDVVVSFSKICHPAPIILSVCTVEGLRVCVCGGEALGVSGGLWRLVWNVCSEVSGACGWGSWACARINLKLIAFQIICSICFQRKYSNGSIC